MNKVEILERIKALKSKTTNQKLLIELSEKSERTAQENKLIETLISAEVKMAKANLAKQKVADLIRSESKKEKAVETRKKILMGAMYTEFAKRDNAWKEANLKNLNAYLKRDDDRALFGLPPLVQTPSPQNQAAQTY